MSEFQKETAFTGYPKIISFDCSQKIIEQMAKDICKINISEEQGTGFFCKIPFPNKDNMLPVLITNNHVINNNILNSNNAKIPFIIKDDINKIKINLKNRKKYTNEKYDITIIEIKEEDGINDYLELDDKIINDIISNKNENLISEKETIYIIHYPEGELSVSYGIFLDKHQDQKYNFAHKCATRRGSSGSPILNMKNKVFGVHKEGANKYNKGAFLNEPIKEFIKQNYTFINKSTKISSNNSNIIFINKNDKSKSQLMPSIVNSYKNNDHIYDILETALIEDCKIPTNYLFSKENKINWEKDGKKGGFEYEPPYGWIGIGLNIRGKYDNGNDDWLECNDNKHEWAYAYYGVNNEKMLLSILISGFIVAKVQPYKNSDDIYHYKKKVGKGVYFSPDIKLIETYCRGVNISLNGKKYMIALMVRVKPDKIRCPSEQQNYWVLNPTYDEVRPYRILLKEKNT